MPRVTGVMDARATWTWLGVLWRHAGLPRERVIRAQQTQLQRLVRHAYHAVPFYRALLDRHGVRPEHIAGPADLARIPATTKQDLRGVDPRELVARGLDPGRLVFHRTSGWSGEPVAIRRTWLEERLYAVARRRALGDFGMRARHHRVSIGLPGRRDPNDHQLPQRLGRAIGLYRRTTVDAFQAPEAIAETLGRLQPDIVGGYPGVLTRVAEALSTADGSPNGFGQGPVRARPAFVVTGGEVLTPANRARITRGFGARVFDVYGSHECPLIAWECTRGNGLHVWDPGVVLEVLVDGRQAQPGERGEVVVTPLYSMAMPFIRYVLGDVVTVGHSRCPCGAPFSTIRAVEGRVIDYFPLADGRVLHPYELVVAALDAAGGWLRQYRLVQERRDRVRMTVTAVRPPSDAELARLEAALSARLGDGATVAVDVVSEIALEASGKFRVSRSLVADRG